MAIDGAVEAARNGTDTLNRWLEERDYPLLDLSGADLSGCDLRWINFSGANLQEVSFSGAILNGAYFGPATFSPKRPYVSRSDVPVDLRGADFSKAILLAATFNYASVEMSSFENSYLGLANFRSIDFSGVSMTKARLLNTSFLGCRLAKATGLDSLLHLGPSHLDIETLFLSPLIPEELLRGAGVPEVVIDYLPDLIVSAEPFLFHSCFISHSSRDKDFCDKLYRRMRKEGLRVWYAPEDMRGGRMLVPQIREAIKVHDKLIVVLSESSLQSEWVANEIRWARGLEASSGVQALFPISLLPYASLKAWELIDLENGADLAAHVRSYFIPDFSRWWDDAEFDLAFQKLLRDLKSEDNSRSIEKNSAQPRLPADA